MKIRIRCTTCGHQGVIWLSGVELSAQMSRASQPAGPNHWGEELEEGEGTDEGTDADGDFEGE